MANLKFITSKLSPFAHRVEMTLLEKNAKFEKQEVDLANKPDWFIKDAPMGKIPLLYIDDKILFESIAICEYLEETIKENPLHPTDPYLKSWNRAWMEYLNGLVASCFGVAFATDKNILDDKIIETYKKIEHLGKYINPKPFFNNNNLTLVDIFCATAFVPIMFLQKNYKIQLFPENAIITNYYNHLSSLENLIKVVPTDYNNIFNNLLTRKNSYLLKIAN
jgi:glutathione S-transferase